MTKPILCLDFDGVIHSFTSGWKGARNIPDPPVTGAFEFILAAQAQFTVAILSSRSHHWGGRRAMKKWLLKHAGAYFAVQMDAGLRAREHIDEPEHLRVLREELRPFDRIRARALVELIQWPIFKPPAMITIDDRALNFNGEWPTIETLAAFKPWYHK